MSIIIDDCELKVPTPGPVRLLHVVGDSKFGGGGVIICRLAAMAQKSGWQVDVLTTDPTFQNQLRNQGTTVVSLDVVRRKINPLTDLIGIIRLWLFLRKNKYDIVHTHTSKAGFVGRLAAKAAGVSAIVHTAHGFAFHEESSRLTVCICALLERIASYACDRIVTVSDFHRTWALRLGIAKADKIMSIPNGISSIRALPRRNRETIRTELEVGKDDLLLLSTGRLADGKGLEYLFDAIRLLCDQGASIRLVCAGGGPLQVLLEKKTVEVGIRDRVKFLGFREDIADLLSASDIVVLPTLREGLSIALLEAMAASKPIITTSIGSNIEATGNGIGAVLVPIRDPQALARAITELSRSELRRQLIGSRAKQIFSRHYMEERMFAGYRTEYNKLLHNTNSVRRQKEMLFRHTYGRGNSVMSTSQTFAKRAIDIGIAAIALLLLSPLFALIAIAIRLESAGPVLFRQKRIGRGTAHFTLFKFRTMVANAPDIRNSNGSTYNAPNDPRCTRVGRLLRLFSLDELPQLLNVLTGTMSLVGPRPDLVDQTRFYGEDEWFRLMVKPGITGLAQISGRNAISWPARTRLDLEYIAQQSVLFDLSILWRTLSYVINCKDVFVTHAHAPAVAHNAEVIK